LPDLVAKQALADEVAGYFNQCQSMVVVDYRGLTVSEVTELRKKCREADVMYKVIKNSIVSRAVQQIGLDEMEPHLTGTNAFAFGMTDAVAPAKILKEFADKTKKITIKAGVLEGKVIDANGVSFLAELPPREVLIAKMLGSMNAPITGLVTVLSGTLKSVLYAINAVREKKESAA